MVRSTREHRHRGIPLSGGVALGRVCLFVPAPPSSEVGAGGPEVEESRLRVALASVSARLEVLAGDADETVGPGEAAILRVQGMMLRDESLWETFAEAIRGEGATAERAVIDAFQRFREGLSLSASEGSAGRVEDINELEGSLLTALGRAAPTIRCRVAMHCTVGQCELRNPHILVISELTPALVMEVDDLTLGLLTQRVGPTSHAAILARAMGLPAVSLSDERLLQRVPFGADLLIDGDRGEVIVSPDPETLAAYEERLRSGPRKMRIAQPVEELQVLANIGRTAELGVALAAHAEGVGLYRTELEPLSLGRLLDEEEQYQRYSAVVQAMAGRAVYIRLLDLGGDKSAEFLGLPPEENPVLGLRGARLLLARPEMLREQVRALARASRAGTIHVIAPMVIDVAQFLELREIFEDEAGRFEGRSLLFGPMLEVPSACLQARQLLAAADFASLGTNDLTQYLFAMDRSNAAVAREDINHHPALWGLIEDLAGAARETGRGLCVCGELAGDATLTRRLIRAGIRQVSVAPRGIAEVRMAARSSPGR